MEQNLIAHHSNNVRNSKSKGSDKKSGLQLLLLIAICIWLLHEILNSHSNHHQSYNENPSKSNTTFAYYLGRKGMMEYEKRDGGVGDDELDVNIIDDLEHILKHEQAHQNKFPEMKQVFHAEHANQESEVLEQIVNDVNIGEEGDVAVAFLDENGIPPDASYFINSIP